MAGSSAITSSPCSGVPPAPASKACDCRLVQSPISGPASNSIMVDSAEPLYEPKVSMAPSIAAAASVVGWPSRSMAQPSGMGLPVRRCSSISPRATMLVAKSKT
ncbi:hypothetical protein D3C72_1835260 [compost metagenome]